MRLDGVSAATSSILPGDAVTTYDLAVMPLPDAACARHGPYPDELAEAR